MPAKKRKVKNGFVKNRRPRGHVLSGTIKQDKGGFQSNGVQKKEGGKK